MSHPNIAAETYGSETDIRRTFQRQILSSVWNACTASAAALLAAHAERRRVKRCIAELSGLSDRMLRDIGVERQEIPCVARYGRDAKRAGV
jgi:uncharacterized protein YjiS (DUF1127 family)